MGQGSQASAGPTSLFPPWPSFPFLACAPVGLAVSAPAGPTPRLGLFFRSCPGWAPRLASLRLGRQSAPRLGLLRVFPGWAGSFAPGCARICSPAGPGRSSPAGRCLQAKADPGRVAFPGKAFPRPALHGPGRDSHIPAGLAFMQYTG
jgi:hypothetical protein